MICIEEKEKCSGCTACFSVCPKKCINMVRDEEGFMYPDVDTVECIDCGLCEKVCPIINPKPGNVYSEAYIARNKDADVVRTSSSGGTFTLLADEILKQGGAVYGAIYDEKHRVRHICISNQRELEKLRGSKYVQSYLGNCFKRVKNGLDKGKRILFSGTPCQVAGLKQYLGREYSNLICIDVICHGVPSPKIWNLYLKRFHKSKITSVTMRDKTHGWRDYSLRLEFEGRKNVIQKMMNNLYGRAFLYDLTLRPSCSNCKYRGMNTWSDITMSDCWHVEQLAPEFNDDKGVTLFFANSDKGIELVSRIKAQMNCKQIPLQQGVAAQQLIFHPKERNKYRDTFFRWSKSGFTGLGLLIFGILSKYKKG